jgi:hypothetical protein
MPELNKTPFVLTFVPIEMELIRPDLIRKFKTAFGHRLPDSFVNEINSFRQPDVLIQLGFFEPKQIVEHSSKIFPLETLGFVPFLVSNSNYFFVGCVGAFEGLIAADGVLFRDRLAGVIFASTNSFLHHLKLISTREQQISLEHFANESIFDVIDDEKISSEADRILRLEAESGGVRSLSLISVASGQFASQMLGASDFLVAEAAAWRLGSLGDSKSLPALKRLAAAKVAAGHVDQHTEAAKSAIKKIESRQP